MNIFKQYYYRGGYGYANYYAGHNYIISVDTKTNGTAYKVCKTRKAVTKCLYAICKRKGWIITSVREINKHCHIYSCRGGQEITVCRW